MTNSNDVQNSADATAGSVHVGSIAFTGCNDDIKLGSNGNLAFVAQQDMLAGRTIDFTDGNWKGTTFSCGNASWAWTATNDIGPGSVVTVDQVPDSNPSEAPSPGFNLANTSLVAGYTVLVCASSIEDLVLGAYSGRIAGHAGMSDHSPLLNSTANWPRQDRSLNRGAGGMAPDLPFSTTAVTDVFIVQTLAIAPVACRRSGNPATRSQPHPRSQ